MATKNTILGTVPKSRGRYTEGDNTTKWYYDNILEYKGSSFRCISEASTGITGAPATYNSGTHTLVPNTGWEFFVDTTGALDVGERLTENENKLSELESEMYKVVQEGSAEVETGGVAAVKYKTSSKIRIVYQGKGVAELSSVYIYYTDGSYEQIAKDINEKKSYSIIVEPPKEMHQIGFVVRDGVGLSVGYSIGTPYTQQIEKLSEEVNGNSERNSLREDINQLANYIYPENKFLLASSISGWKSSPILYIDYVYKNTSDYGSGIRVLDESRNEVLYKRFPVEEKKRVSIEKIVEQKDDIIISLVVNWDYYEDGFNKVLDEPIYLSKLSFMSDSSQSLANEQKIIELSSYLPKHVKIEANDDYFYLHDKIGFQLKKGEKIINNGIKLIIASDISLTDRVDIPTGASYILDSDKEFLSTYSTGLVDFIYISLANPGDVDELRKEVEETRFETIGLSLPSKIYAIVGDTLQIFYRGLMSVVNPYNYDILVSCSKGKQYPRYFEYTPTSADIGEVTFSISVKNSNGDIIEKKSCKLITKNVPTSVENKINIACFGDSLTVSGMWCAEAYRRLTKTDGNPMGIGLSNINFVGKKKTNNGAGFYGEGGWRWNHYVTEGERAFRFFVTNINLLSIGSQYNNNGSTFTIKEINVTEGSGNILCSVDGANDPQSNGVLTLASGNGDASVSFTSYNRVPTNPLWDATNNKMSFIPYTNEYAEGQLDVVYVLLGWNDVNRESYPYPTMMADCKTFIDTLHLEFPNAKVKLMGLQVCSINGGMGANYGATGSSYADTFGTIRNLMGLNRVYKELAELAEYSSFVEYVDVASQFDSEYNMPYAETKVNTRSSLTERRGTNGVHPSTDGYMQIADVVYRNIVANL